MTDLILQLSATPDGTQAATVEAFAGTHIDSACKQATNVASLLDVVVRFDFNGVQCYARPRSDWQTLKEAWEKIYSVPPDKRSRHAMAWSAPRTGAE